jgi:hypothetical protein
MQRYQRRLEVIKRAADIREPAEAELWKWLASLVTEMGEKGVSSDETDCESTSRVAVVKRMPWRRECEHYLDFIDEQRVEGDLFVTKGQQPMVRVRNARAPISNRTAPKNLPAAIYSPQWVRSLSSHNRHHVYVPSDATFHWKYLKMENTSQEQEDFD